MEYYFAREIRTLVQSLNAVKAAIADFERLEGNLLVMEKKRQGQPFIVKSKNPIKIKGRNC